MRGGSSMSYPRDTPRRTPRRNRRPAPAVQRRASSPGGAAATVPARRRFPATTYSFAPFGALAAIAGAASRRVEEEQRLYEITVPGLEIESEFTDVRRSLIAAFPRVVEVSPVCPSGTVRIAYVGEDEIDAWCETLSRAVALRRRALLPARQSSAAR
jgi:hypothetical protein